LKPGSELKYMLILSKDGVPLLAIEKSNEV